VKWQKRIAIGAAVASLLGTVVWFILGRRVFPIVDELEPEVEA
jgi:hypothetical protein